MLLTMLVSLSLGQPTLDYALNNGYWDLAGNGAELTWLRMSPSGNRNYGANWLVALRLDGFETGDRTRVQQWASQVRVSGLRRRYSSAVQVGEHHRPDPLAPGHSLGQSFTVEHGSFDSMSIPTPTWHSSDSAATLRLRREGPDGELLAERRLAPMVDNQESELSFEPLGPGRYYVELSEASGTPGWWTNPGDPLPGGQAYADGQPLESGDRGLTVRAEEVGAAAVTWELKGPRLLVTATWENPADRRVGAPELLLVTPWKQEGYDVSAASGAVFSRVYSDRQRLLPAEQLKRQSINYGPGLDGTWIRFAGYDNTDLRVEGASVGYNWHAAPRQLINRLSVPGSATTVRYDLLAEPHRAASPDDWPSFFSDDAQLDADLNRFLWERVMSYPGGGSTPWVVWSGITGDWYAGPRRDAQRAAIAGLTIDDEGYVYTWGGARGWPFPDNEKYDTRHFDTNARFIIAAWQHYAWTGDREFLASQAERLKRAMAYQLTQLHGEDGLLVAASADVNGKHLGLGNNYWDIMPFGHLDAYANAYYLASLRAMANIEAALGQAPTHDWGALADRCRAAYDRTFWDEDAGRYIGCVDIDGQRHDYGFTFVNLEALAYGQGDADKARRIYNWLENGPTWEGKNDIYSRWVFAPRATTIHNPRWGDGAPPAPPGAGAPWWMPGWHGTAWEEQCQDGGAILYTSYYDLVARQRYFGIASAWQRFSAILNRYREPDRLCGGPPLYRGENPQQLNPGAVGVDIPFPESGLVPCWFLEGVVGVEALPDGLHIAPNLPPGLNRAGVRNLAWHGRNYTVSVAREEGGVRVDLAADGRDRTHRLAAGQALLLRDSAAGQLPSAELVAR